MQKSAVVFNTAQCMIHNISCGKTLSQGKNIMCILESCGFTPSPNLAFWIKKTWGDYGHCKSVSGIALIQVLELISE